MTLQFNTDKPIFLQLAEEIRQSILNGNLKEGEFIPSVRKLSSQFELNPITVMNTIKTLVEEGILDKKRGLGMQIKVGTFNKLKEERKNKFLNKDLVNVIKNANLLGISLSDLKKQISIISKEIK
ncbi:MAG: GntR family transcriptional regulator [Candidatus Marinimicrobia bacterium]|nr:GntR family transcriptional regulator [Candidatus Neomarinimicrobiota bacterium]